MEPIIDEINGLLTQLRALDGDERAPVLARLTELCKGPEGNAVRSLLETAARGEILEIQWELEEVLEATAPPKKEEPKPPKKEEPPEDPNRPLTSKDLEMVYDDPRGLVLHRTRDGKRWFATQVDPRTRQPQTFELHPDEIRQIKAQLAGSPYWVLGSGAR